MNSHKGDIEGCDPEILIERGKGEFDELLEAMRDGDPIHIMAEVGDILNFAVAAAHTAIDNYRNRKHGTKNPNVTIKLDPRFDIPPIAHPRYSEESKRKTLDDSGDDASAKSSGTHVQCGGDCKGDGEDYRGG